MSLITRLLLFFILPLIAVLSFPPDTLAAALPMLAVVAVVFVILGIFLWRGRSLALTLSICTFIMPCAEPRMLTT